MTREGIEKHLTTLREDYAKAVQIANQAQLLLGAIRFAEQLLKEDDDALSKPSPNAGVLRERRSPVELSHMGVRDSQPEGSAAAEVVAAGRPDHTDEEWR